MAALAKAIADPVRLQLVDVLRKRAREGLRVRARAALRPLPAYRSHHLKVLRDAGIVDSERQGLWAYYYVAPDALDELSTWLS